MNKQLLKKITFKLHNQKLGIIVFYYFFYNSLQIHL